MMWTTHLNGWPSRTAVVTFQTLAFSVDVYVNMSIATSEEEEEENLIPQRHESLEPGRMKDSRTLNGL